MYKIRLRVKWETARITWKKCNLQSAQSDWPMANPHRCEKIEVKRTQEQISQSGRSIFETEHQRRLSNCPSFSEIDGHVLPHNSGKFPIYRNITVILPPPDPTREGHVTFHDETFASYIDLINSCP